MTGWSSPKEERDDRGAGFRATFDRGIRRSDGGGRFRRPVWQVSEKADEMVLSFRGAGLAMRTAVTEGALAC